MTSKTLVCGATGFIGRNILEALSKTNPQVVVAHWNIKEPFEISGMKDSIEWRRANLLKREEVRSLLDGVDTIIQAAAVTSGSKDITERPHIHVCDNAVMNSLLLAEACAQGVKRIIFMSCSVMYESNAGALKETQVNLNKIDKRYFGAAHTKLYIERMLEFYSMTYGIQCMAIRHSNIYGPHDKFDEARSHFFGATVRKIFDCNDGTISVWGDGTEKKDLLYVSDLVRFIQAALRQGWTGYEIVNCGSSCALAISEIVTRMVDLSGRQLSIRYDLDKPHINATIEMCCDRIRTHYGWQATTTIDEGIQKTYRWYRNPQ
ncbi:NAD-dependent epimerase/dehydratase family protein [Cyanobium sp. Alchichica 3B3-8F6]|uniref:NAD-dependent epimerase/dehydratase family protein n=1 Tax=Cyanobium sp. Alchichica 3B3-8F6 TaxID=2823696 RepID=UPI0020CCE497|nr:NAD-dependent epimerase/dehydratase family protein [Cyanobium sp. Alchichica 3B3-8F6]MCP9882395.1 NAD-dependent epimerase/dehydratase family protein [Cyanobium sp. Alchichica 3B3-8F6]